MALPLNNPALAFSDRAIEQESVHICIAYADNTRWASVYQLTDLPAEVNSLIRDTKSLAKKIMQEQTLDKIEGDTALRISLTRRSLKNMETIPALCQDIGYTF